MDKQKTIFNSFTLSGKGLHTGNQVTIKFLPAEPNFGIVFKRVDLAEKPTIEAIADYVTDTSRGTTLTKNNINVKTVEHVLAAIFGLGIDNLLIEIDCDETPILDGSSGIYTNEFLKNGIIQQEADKEFFTFKEEISIYDSIKDVDIKIIPCDEFKVTCIIDYNSKVLPMQQITMNSINEFESEFAQARTFVFLHELEPLIKHGLIKGGDIQNAVVFVEKTISAEEQKRLVDYFNAPDVVLVNGGVLNNNKLRFENEPARHKLLDILGDISLVGIPFKGHIIAKRPGHKTNTDFAKKIRNYINFMS